jgi:hypothetical protein
MLYVGGPLIYRTFVDPEPVLGVLNDTARTAGSWGR